MAKQKGTYRIKGKYNGVAYYSVKNGIGDVLRTINPQLSERVKTAPEYRNTRAYAAEFGVATGISKEIFGTLKYCGANITDQTQVTKLCSMLLKFVHNDQTHPIGRRTLSNFVWQKSARSFINKLSKNPIDGTYLANLRIGWRRRIVSTIPTIDFRLNTSAIVEDVERLASMGISNIRLRVFACHFEAKRFYEQSGQYIPSGSDFAEIVNKRLPRTDWEKPFTIENTITGDRVLTEDDNSMTCFLVIVTPYRSHFGGLTPLQSLIAFKTIPIPEDPF